MKPENLWALRFSLASAAGAVVLIALAWAILDARPLGLDAAGTIAVALGIFFSIALAVGLMTLMFYSDRSGRDDIAGDARRPAAERSADDRKG